MTPSPAAASPLAREAGEGGRGVEDLPEGVLAVRLGPGANCSSAGSAIDILFYGSVIVGAVAVALAAAFPPRDDADEGGEGEPPAVDAAQKK